LLGQLTKRVRGLALEGEVADHLGYDAHDPARHHGASPATVGARRRCMVKWQNRRLKRVYPVVFSTAINVTVRDGQVANRPTYLAVAVSVECTATCSVCGPATAAKVPSTGST
jgi:hypothetical protein